jgi:hypothetical protein
MEVKGGVFCAQSVRLPGTQHKGDGVGSTVPQHSVFYVVSAAAIAMQRHDKHTSSTRERLCFLHGPCREVILKTTGTTVQLRVQLWRQRRDHRS